MFFEIFVPSWLKAENPFLREWICYILFRFECNLSRKENCPINGDDRDSLVFRLLVFGRLLLRLPARTVFCILLFPGQSFC